VGRVCSESRGGRGGFADRQVLGGTLPPIHFSISKKDVRTSRNKGIITGNEQGSGREGAREERGEKRLIRL
jgi:hypothetical protein